MVKLEAQVILELDTPNKNNRTYTTAVVSGTLERLKGRRVVGLTAPVDIKGGIDLLMVSHFVHDLRVVDSKLLGDVEILDTPRGLLLQKMVKEAEVAFRPFNVMVGGGPGIVDWFDIGTIVAIDAKQAA